uniref:Predicted protein n=1 Tax=Hordeum vulgare subsp. vulgare TaxID=112509 RepID=F2DYQ9_HORVV|nr:predicted protein [Hordeum vulgare subsp. vulgare]
MATTTRTSTVTTTGSRRCPTACLSPRGATLATTTPAPAPSCECRPDRWLLRCLPIGLSSMYIRLLCIVLSRCSASPACTYVSCV